MQRSPADAKHYLQRSTEFPATAEGSVVRVASQEDDTATMLVYGSSFHKDQPSTLTPNE